MCLICGLLGVLTTIALAWATALIEHWDGLAWKVHRVRIPEHGEGEGDVAAHLMTGFGYRWYSAVAHDIPSRMHGSPWRMPQPGDPTPEQACPRWARAHLLPWCEGAEPWPDPPAASVRHVYVTGWPFPCLYRLCLEYEKGKRAAIEREGWRDVPMPPFFERGYAVRGAIPWNIPRIGGKDRLPLYPRWLALVSDILFHAVVWFALLSTPGVLRRARRRRRGRCPGCGYDLRGLPARARCPECGAGP